MSFIDRIATRFGYERKRDPIAPARQLGMYAATTAPDTNFNYETFVKDWNPNVSIAARVISNAVKGIPLNIGQVRVEAGKERFYDDDSHPLNAVLRRPNPRQTISEIKSYIAQGLLLTGNAFLAISRERGVVEWWPIPLGEGQSIEVKYDPFGRVSQYVHTLNGKETNLDSRDIIHFRLTDIAKPHFGKSFITPFLDVLRSDRTIDKSNRAWIDNDCNVGGILSPKEGDIDAAQFEKMIDQFKAKHKGAEKAGELFASNISLGFESTTDRGKDGQFLGLSKLNREKIFGGAGVPPILAGMLEFSNYSVAKEQSLIFYEYTVMPLCATIAEAFTRASFDETIDPDMEFRFDYSGVKCLQADDLQKSQRLSILVTSGILTPNEAREEYELGKLDGGDELRQPGSFGLAPLDDEETDDDDNPKKPPNQTDEDEDAKRTKSLIIHGKASKRNILVLRHNQYDAKAVLMTKVMRGYLNGQKARVFAGLDALTDNGKFMSSLVQFHLQPGVPVKKSDDEPTPANAEIIFNQTLENELLGKSTNGTIKRILAESGDEALAEIGATIDFNVTLSNVKRIAESFQNRLTNINDTQYKRIRNLLARAYDQGLTIGETKRLLQASPTLFSAARAELIARTETVGYVSAATKEGYLQGGVERIEWIATQDDKTRPSHSAADGQTVAIGQPFSIGGVSMEHPGDPNAPVEETANCRCAMAAAA